MRVSNAAPSTGSGQGSSSGRISDGAWSDRSDCSARFASTLCVQIDDPHAQALRGRLALALVGERRQRGEAGDFGFVVRARFDIALRFRRLRHLGNRSANCAQSP